MTGRQKILAVDDSLLTCQQIEKVLKNEEYTVYKSIQRRRLWSYWRKWTLI